MMEKKAWRPVLSVFILYFLAFLVVDIFLKWLGVWGNGQSFLIFFVKNFTIAIAVTLVVKGREIRKIFKNQSRGRNNF